MDEDHIFKTNVHIFTYAGMQLIFQEMAFYKKCRDVDYCFLCCLYFF